MWLYEFAWGCHNKVPQTRPLKQQIFYFLTVLEVQDQGWFPEVVSPYPHLDICSACLCPNLLSL